MSLIFRDGFDIYSAVANMSARGYTSLPTAIETSIVRNSLGRAIRTIGATIARFPLGANYEYIYVGVAVQVATTTTTQNQIISFWDSGTQQCTVGFNGTTNQFYVARGSATGTILNTGSNTFSQNAWHYVEVKAQINSSTAASGFLVYVNGVLEITVTTASDTNSNANNYCNNIGIGGAGSASLYFDDLYVRDDSVYLTTPRIVTLYPDGNGNQNQWVGSDGNSTDNYLLVNSTLYQTTTYVESDVVNDNDLYTVGNLPFTPDVIHCVTVSSLMTKDNSGARQARLLVRSGSTNYEGAAIALSETATYYSFDNETDPNTSAAWTPANVNAMEIGVTVEA